MIFIRFTYEWFQMNKKNVWLTYERNVETPTFIGRLLGCEKESGKISYLIKH